jgi:hypothetical protein
MTVVPLFQRELPLWNAMNGKTRKTVMGKMADFSVTTKSGIPPMVTFWRKFPTKNQGSF